MTENQPCREAGYKEPIDILGHDPFDKKERELIRGFVKLYPDYQINGSMNGVFSFVHKTEMGNMLSISPELLDDLLKSRTPAMPYQEAVEKVGRALEDEYTILTKAALAALGITEVE